MHHRTNPHVARGIALTIALTLWAFGLGLFILVAI